MSIALHRAGIRRGDFGEAVGNFLNECMRGEMGQRLLDFGMSIREQIDTEKRNIAIARDSGLTRRDEHGRANDGRS